jgi:diguanylate cyclase (GGDEF)-like protein
VDIPAPEQPRVPAKWRAGIIRRHAEILIFVACAVAAAGIAAADLLTPADIRPHGLYVFPLAIVARYCTRLGWSILLFLLTTALQILAYWFQYSGVPSVISDICVPLATSVLILLLARGWRASYVKAARLAATDSLTGLANRRAFLADLDAEIARQERYGRPFSLAVLDLDGFKALNDSKGHHAGDEALRVVADVLRTGTRKSDSLARIGGDEFGILMPNTDSDCATMMHSLCTTIAQRTAAADCGVTTSIGCQTFRAPPESTADALQQADSVMYQAKSKGKNRAAHSGQQQMNRADVLTNAAGSVS